MAESSFAIDIPNDFENNAVNKPSEVNANFTEIETQFNASMETTTGHYHDGVDSRLLSGSAFTSADTFMMMIGGGIS